jgi:hypothetical protein
MPDVVAITVSAVTPASSVFVIAPFAIQQAGSGAFLSFHGGAAGPDVRLVLRRAGPRPQHRRR